MKLLRKSAKAVVLQVSAMDRRLMEAVLSSFEQLPRRDEKLSMSGAVPEAEEELLHAALRDQRVEQWKWFTELSASKGTWAKEGKDWKLTLPPDRIESLLQMLNDIRVSSWKILGSPEDLPRGPFAPDTVQGVAGWLLLTTGYLQTNLLHTVEGPAAAKKKKSTKSAKPSAKPHAKKTAKKPKRPKKD